MVSFNEAEALKSFAVPLSYLPAFSRAYAARVEASMAGRSLESSQECAHEMKPSTETGDQPAREREMTRQLDKFEWKKGTDPKNPEVGVDLKLATKKYQRSSADKAYRSQDVRSLDACWKTMEYLMTEILDFDSNPKPGFAVQAIPYIEAVLRQRQEVESTGRLRPVDLHLQQPRSTTQRVFVETHERPGYVHCWEDFPSLDEMSKAFQGSALFCGVNSDSKPGIFPFVWSLVFHRHEQKEQEGQVPMPPRCCLRFEMLSLYLLLGRGQNQALLDRYSFDILAVGRLMGFDLLLDLVGILQKKLVRVCKEKATEKYDTKLGLKAISQTIEPLLNAYQALHEKQVAKSILAEAMGGFGLADEDDDEDYYSPYEMAARRYIVLLLMSFAPDETLACFGALQLSGRGPGVFGISKPGLYRETDFLSAVAMSGVADLVLHSVRTYPQQVGDRISLAKLKNILAFVSDDHAKTFLAFHGLQIVIDKESDGGAHVVLPKTPVLLGMKGSPEANALPLLQGPARLPEKCEFPKALGLSRADIAIGHADPIAEVTLVAAEAPQDAGGDVVAEEMMAEEQAIMCMVGGTNVRAPCALRFLLPRGVVHILGSKWLVRPIQYYGLSLRLFGAQYHD
ncbi:unnamed protein product [Symbiodinium microadriaticum]|nr:unnamed protein product [Symbiodinium microadriaticum]